MQPLSAGAVLEAWERSAEGSATEQALALLGEAYPQAGAGEIEALPLGERDRRLLKLRRRTLGRPLEGHSQCPRCAESLEFSLATEQLLAGAASRGGAPGELRLGELRVRFRLPDSTDLEAAQTAASAEAARDLLLARCVLEAHRGGRAVAAGELSADETAALAARMAEVDPAAELLLDLECAGCGHRWRQQLDIAGFFAAEIDLLARRLLAEVHALARGYGWREADILAMSAHRRRRYLELLGG